MEINTAVMVRIGELWLKSEQVKKQFMASLMRNIRASLDAAGIEYKTEEYRGRILIYGDAERIASVVSRVFGIVDVSICTTCGNSPEEIAAAAVAVADGNLRPGMRFAVRARRQHVGGFTSQELARIVADAVWDQVPNFLSTSFLWKHVSTVDLSMTAVFLVRVVCLSERQERQCFFFPRESTLRLQHG